MTPYWPRKKPWMPQMKALQSQKTILYAHHAKEKGNGLPNGMARSFYSWAHSHSFFHPVSCQWPPADQEKVTWQKLMSQKIRKLCLSPLSEGKWPTQHLVNGESGWKQQISEVSKKTFTFFISLNETQGINLFCSHFFLNSLDINCPSML